jgi:predicted nucleotidyltransferase
MRELDETAIPGLDIEEIVRILERVPVTLGVLYGSHAQGEATGGSDIDLAVAFDESLSSVERTRARLELIEQLSTGLETDDVDVVPLSDAPSELLEEILTDGVLIYGSMTDLEPYQGQPPHRRVIRTDSPRSTTFSRNSTEWCDVDERTERRLVEKAEYVGKAVALLAAKRDSLSFDEYRTDREQRDIVEREFETAIEACIDIGEMILRPSLKTAESKPDPRRPLEDLRSRPKRFVYSAVYRYV